MVANIYLLMSVEGQVMKALINDDLQYSNQHSQEVHRKLDRLRRPVEKPGNNILGVGCVYYISFVDQDSLPPTPDQMYELLEMLKCYLNPTTEEHRVSSQNCSTIMKKIRRPPRSGISRISSPP